jgi:hypothetical protein
MPFASGRRQGAAVPAGEHSADAEASVSALRNRARYDPQLRQGRRPRPCAGRTWTWMATRPPGRRFRRTWPRGRSVRAHGETKTERSRRTLGLPAAAVQALRAWPTARLMSGSRPGTTGHSANGQAHRRRQPGVGPPRRGLAHHRLPVLGPRQPSDDPCIRRHGAAVVACPYGCRSHSDCPGLAEPGMRYRRAGRACWGWRPALHGVCGTACVCSCGQARNSTARRRRQG